MKNFRAQAWIILVVSILLLFLVLDVGQPAIEAKELLQIGESEVDLIEELNRETQGDLRISYNSKTGKVRFIGTDTGQEINLSNSQSFESSEAAALNFLHNYGALFGLAAPEKELDVTENRGLEDGRTVIRYQQIYEGLPIIGGELVVHVSPRQGILSASGEILSDIDIATAPTLNAASAQETAVAKVGKDYGLDRTDLIASDPVLSIFNSTLLGGPGVRMNTLVWQIEVTAKDLLPIREFVLVDAQLGVVSLNFNQIDTAKDRKIYDNNNNPSLGLPGNGPVRTEGQAATGITDVDLAYDYAGDTYDFFLNEHNRDSLDNAGLTLTSTTRYCPDSLNCPYANAFWNGTQMAYGAGYSAADDVVGHELTHGVTEFTSNLFYYYQSGAINESLSDVWGEFIDQGNGSGTDTAGVKWLMGEDIPGGAIRDMEDPTVFGDPDKMTSPNYYCNQAELYGPSGNGSGDNGGVHTNSGVNNKAAYLMTDGGTFNGFNVTGLGISKVADLYYEVQTNLLTSAADYADLYDALIQASINLGYSAADQQEIQDALNAVEMNQDPTSCPAPEAPVCDSGTPSNLFFDDIESGSGNWAPGSLSGTAYWFVPQTTSTIGFAKPYATSGTGNIWSVAQGSPFGGTSDTFLAMNSDVMLPANAYLHFNHAFGFESSTPSGTTKYDGGILEYSLNGGSSWNNAGSLITHNGYNGTLEATNPLGGISAFSADSRGYISSRLDLSSLVGQNVRFRFRIGTDSSVYDYGWFIDDVRIYTCDVGTNTSPSITGLPDQTLGVDGSKDNAIDLWAYASDNEDADADLTFTISNTPIISAGVTIDSNRYIDINPTAGWTGSTNVTVQVEDSGSLTDSDTFQVTVTDTYQVYLPVILKPAPSGPTPGFWESSTGDEFYVTPDRAFVADFAIYITVNGCGNYKITHTVQEPITNDQFSFTGPFYASGTFNSATAASGTDGLTNFNISGCGLVSGGPWAWNAAWQNSSQPPFLPVDLIGPETAVPTIQTGKNISVIVTPLN